LTGSFNSKGGVQSREDSSPEILVVADEKVLEKILGQRDENIRAVEERFPVRITVRGDEIQVHGPDIEVVKLVAKFLGQLAEVAEKGYRLTPAEVKYGMNILGEGGKVDLLSLYEEVIYITSRGKPVRPRTAGQKKYIEAIRRNEVVFAIGPAGTGKTYLAVAMAVAALKASVVSRIVLVRPVVEAGERLGFLPGDVKEKVEPYLRPLYDAFFEKCHRTGAVSLYAGKDVKRQLHNIGRSSKYDTGTNEDVFDQNGIWFQSGCDRRHNAN